MKSGYVVAWLATLLLLATTCQAQPRGGNESPRGGNRSRARFSRDILFRLLEMPPVRTELALRPLQIKTLEDLQADLGEQRRAVLSSGDPLGLSEGPGAGRDTDEPERGTQARFEAMRDAAEKVRMQGEKLVTVILDDSQMKRLNQLRLQDEGARAFDRREFREQLGVTDEQYQQIQQLLRGEVDASLSRLRRQQKLNDAVLALLNQEQQIKFKELQGEAFEFPLQLPAELRGLRDSLDGGRPGLKPN